MPETEEQRRMREADRAARSMFGGGLFAPNFLQRAGAALASARVPSERELLPPSQLASPSMPQLGPLVRTDYGLPPSERPDWRNPMQQWDVRRPQPPAIVSRQVTPTPAAPAFLTPAEQGFYDYTGLSPQSREVVGAARRPLEIAQYQSNLASAPTIDQRIAEARFGTGSANMPLVTQPSAAAVGQTPIIESGPVTMTAAGTLTPEQTGRRAIPTPYGTIYATAEQEANMARQRTASQQSSRSPAEQAALLAQMRRQGSQIRGQIGGLQESFFAQKRAEREALRAPEAAARAAGIGSIDIMKAREIASGPYSVAGAQRQFNVGPMPTIGTTVSRFASALPSSVRPAPSGPMGPSGYALAEQQAARRRAAGGDSNPYSNQLTQQRRRTRETAIGLGMEPARNTRTRRAQEEYFRSIGA